MRWRSAVPCFFFNRLFRHHDHFRFSLAHCGSGSFFGNEKGTTDSLLPPPEDLRINCAFNVQILNLPTKAGLGFLPSPSCELVKQALSQPFKARSSDKSSGAMK